MKFIQLFLVAASIVILSGNAVRSPMGSLVTVSIRDLGPKLVDEIKNAPSVAWWVEGGDQMLLALNTGNVSDINPDDLVVIHGGHTNLVGAGVKPLFSSGRSIVIERAMLSQLPTHSDGEHESEHQHWSIEPLVPNTVLTRSAANEEPQPMLWSADDRVAARRASTLINGPRWFKDVTTLAGWNRHISAADIVRARDFIADNFRKIGLQDVRLQEFNVSSRKAWNVIGSLNPAKTGDIYVVGGHYDSISERVSSTAPGAEDNASGAAGVLELARVMKQLKGNATIVFIAFSGEEEGLIGSYAYVKSLDAATRARVKGVINMDMIGYSKDASLDVLLETDDSFRKLSDEFAVAAATFTALRVYRSYNPFGSDHMPFIEQDIPALLTIDNDWNNYGSYHRTTDTSEKVSEDMGREILKMNAAVLASWYN